MISKSKIRVCPHCNEGIETGRIGPVAEPAKQAAALAGTAVEPKMPVVEEYPLEVSFSEDYDDLVPDYPAPEVPGIPDLPIPPQPAPAPPQPSMNLSPVDGLKPPVESLPQKPPLPTAPPPPSSMPKPAAATRGPTLQEGLTKATKKPSFSNLLGWGSSSSGTERTTPDPKAVLRARGGGGTLRVFKAYGDGSCGIHAVLGVYDAASNTYRYAGTDQIRFGIAGRITGGQVDVSKYHERISGLLLDIYQKNSVGTGLELDESRLWNAFKGIPDIGTEMERLSERQGEKFAENMLLRKQIIQDFQGCIAENRPAYSPLRRYLVDEILTHDDLSARTVKPRLQAITSPEAREQVIVRHADTLGDFLTGRLGELTERARSIPELGGLVARCNAYKLRTDEITFVFKPLVEHNSKAFLDAYAATLKIGTYFLTESDVETLADMLKRPLVIYYEYSAGRFDLHNEYTPRGGAAPGASPIRVFHKGRHWDRAELS